VAFEQYLLTADDIGLMRCFEVTIKCCYTKKHYNATL